MSDTRHHRISERAYHLWLEAGCPHGRDLDHWLQAQHEIEAREGAADTSADAVEAAFEAADERAEALATATLEQADRRARTVAPRRRARTAAA